MNEILQWMALVILGVLVLGLLRQVALSLPAPLRSNTTSGPRVGQRLPKQAVTELMRALPREHLEEGTLVAFVIESCTACQRLLADLEVSGSTVLDRAIVLVARNASAQFRKALTETGIPTIHDDGKLWQACAVTNTPLILKLDSEGRVVTKGVTHHVEAVASAAS